METSRVLTHSIISIKKKLSYYPYNNLIKSGHVYKIQRSVFLICCQHTGKKIIEEKSRNNKILREARPGSS